MYRETDRAPTVQCSSCGQSMPQSESVFSQTGDLVCMRCHGFSTAHAQVERARAAMVEQAQGRGMIAHLVATSQADAVATHKHHELHAMQRGGTPLAAPSRIVCQSCGTVVPSAEAVFTPAGMNVCRPCEGRMRSRSDDLRAKNDVQLKIVGLVAFLVILAIGIALLIYVLRHAD
jgi:hypothetical protein